MRILRFVVDLVLADAVPGLEVPSDGAQLVRLQAVNGDAEPFFIEPR